MTHLRHGRPHRIRGWALIRARNALLPQRRYMRLIHYTLTVFDAADEEGDLVILEEILVGAHVSLLKHRREIVVKLPTDRLLVQLRTDREFDAWSLAFRDAARLAVNFYTIVASRQLGSGAFSNVYFGFDREDGHHVAVKVVDKTRCSRAELLYAETEARMMAYVRHPRIVLCRDIFDAPDAMHVIMEYMSGSTLEQRLLSRPLHARRFSEDIIATVMAHVLSALAYLEAEGVCHRDVKPDNVLLSTLRNDSLWPTSARLSDFGLAAFVEGDSDLTDVVGTPHYVAPEVISRGKETGWPGYGPPVDVWAAGIVMYWMLSGGCLPFDGDDPPAIFKSIRAGVLDLDTDALRAVSTDAKHLLRCLLQAVPSRRVCAAAALTHPWLARAQDASGAPAVAAWRLRERAARTLSLRARFRASVTAVLAMRRLTQKAKAGCVRPRARVRAVRRLGKKGVEGKMPRAPERAPIGADGLGYNLGLIPSFAPKRRAKAGVTAPANRTIRDLSKVRSDDDTTGRVRMSKDSTLAKGSESDGSRTPSGERAASMDRRSIGSSGGSLSKGTWGFILRGRSSAEKSRVSFS